MNEHGAGQNASNFSAKEIENPMRHLHEHRGHRFDRIERLRSSERTERMEVERVVSTALEGTQVQTVIDIGTGSGLFAEAFAARGLSVAGIDVNPAMLEAARHHVPGGDFREAVAELLPFPDGTFDLAFLGLVLHETDDLPKALQEAYRVSKTRVVVLEWPYAEQDFGPGIEERLRPELVDALGQQAGFQPADIIPMKNLMLYRFEKGREK